MRYSLKNHLIILCTSMSSLFLRSGASIIFLRQKESDSTSNGVPVNSAIRSQCLSFIALLVIISSRGHDSLKSSILFFRSKKACQSLSPFGSLRHLSEKKEKIFHLHISLKKVLYIYSNITEDKLICDIPPGS